MLSAENIFLRELESIDVDFILACENNTKNWEISGTSQEFTKQEIDEFVNAPHDIYKNEQIRFVICLKANSKPIGTVDLFEFDIEQKTVGVGILIEAKESRNKGFATEALNLISSYSRNELNVVTIFCNIIKNNVGSIC